MIEGDQSAFNATGFDPGENGPTANPLIIILAPDEVEVERSPGSLKLFNLFDTGLAVLFHEHGQSTITL